ncbi:MAG: DUF2089 domain-containing protein [Armatimonadetes bacterium]|nr:DUF2089 domain-containing protein [Armatimonadota bacterium]
MITEVACGACGTQVRSRYRPCAFCALTAEQLVFAQLFVEKRGNLREMEKSLGVSYPTVRGKLEEIAERLAGAPVPSEPEPRGGAGAEAEARREVLRLIAEGRLSPKQGLARLRARAAGPTGEETPPTED